MLEHRVLLLGVREAGVQAVRADDGAALGFARWRPEASRPWLPLWSYDLLSVHEQEDEPLLFTVRRPCGLWPRRQVCDADGQPVGTLRGRWVRDRLGRPVAALHDGAFRSPRGRVLAELAATADGRRLTFADDIAAEPFLKMLLLAAALTV